MHFTRNGLDFVWNTEKAVANVQKHGIRFESATFVFVDPFVLIEDASVSGEFREAAIGQSEGLKLVFVVHIARRGRNSHHFSAASNTARTERL